jgi:two-component system chemotaxis response regulator CheB
MHEAPDRPEEGVRVIALVGSAGGLAAVSEVLSGLPADVDAAVIVLIHQAPERESRLVQILGRRSRLPVEAVRDHAPLRAGTVVVVPPGKHGLIAAGPVVRLIASGASPPSRPSADLLLATLATACGPRATAVVLSGGGHDGATGATAVHCFGGSVLASDELTSEHFSMPQATIERDSTIARIVPLGEIAALLASRARPPDESQKPAHERDKLADEREGTAEQREVERRERARAAAERERQARGREQAQINREIAATGREMARDASDEEPAHDAGARDSTRGLE